MSKPLTFVLIFAFFFSCTFMIYEQLNSNATGTDTIVVQRNDTLWGIAEEFASDKDPRHIVNEIKALNGLENATIYPGQELIVPSSEPMLGLDNQTENSNTGTDLLFDL